MPATDEASKPTLYEESSQYRHWRFSPEQIQRIRQSSNDAAVERVREEWKEAQEEEKENKQYLSVQEELALCRFYEKQLQSICRHLKFSDAVMATAVIYMKRFFLYNTVMDYHPKDILLTCLFLASKSESERISIDDFCKKLQLPSGDNILNLEFTVSQGLKFQYLVHHPYRPAYGFYLDLQTVDDVDLAKLKETYAKVPTVIGSMLLTDLPLIYQPSQLAVAAFAVAGKDNGFDQQVKSYLELRFGKSQADEIWNLVGDIRNTLHRLVTVTPDEAKIIDRRLRVCRNPAKNPDSTLYKKRAAQEELEDEKRRRKKAREESDDEVDDDDDEEEEETPVA